MYRYLFNGLLFSIYHYLSSNFNSAYLPERIWQLNIKQNKIQRNIKYSIVSLKKKEYIRHTIVKISDHLNAMKKQFLLSRSIFLSRVSLNEHPRNAQQPLIRPYILPLRVERTQVAALLKDRRPTGRKFRERIRFARSRERGRNWGETVGGRISALTGNRAGGFNQPSKQAIREAVRKFVELTRSSNARRCAALGSR